MTDKIVSQVNDASQAQRPTIKGKILNPGTYKSQDYESSTKLNNRQQTIAQLRALGMQDGDRTYLKVYKGKGRGATIYQIELAGDTFKLWHTRPNGENPLGGKHWETNGEPKHDGRQYLFNLSQKGAECYVLPTLPSRGIGKQCPEVFQNLFWESDDKSLEAQKKETVETLDKLGLRLYMQIFSGGKSYHNYLRLSRSVSPETWQRLQQKLIVLFRSDPAIENQNREMRLAGMQRAKKGTFQSLEYLDLSAIFDPDELEAALDSTGKFPYGLSGEQFKEWKRQPNQYRLHANNPEHFHKPKFESLEQAYAYADATLQIDPALQQKVKETAPKRYAVPDSTPNPLSAAGIPWQVAAASYLPGFREHGRSGWATGQCPAHGTNHDFTHNPAHSSDSLHINLKTGQIKCHSGCDGKDVIRRLKTLARKHNIKITKFKTVEQSPEEREKHREARLKLDSAMSDAAKAAGVPLLPNGFGDRDQEISKTEWNKKHSSIRNEWEKEEEELRAIAKADKERKLKDWKKEREKTILAAYIKGIELSKPDVSLNQRYLDFNSLLDVINSCGYKNILICSGTGTGKTSNIEGLTEKFPDGHVFTYRNSILQNLQKRIPVIEYIWDDEYDIEIEANDKESKKIQRSFNRAKTHRLQNKKGWISSCVNSCCKFLQKPVYVIEESSKVLSDLYLSDTMKHNRGKILADFKVKISASNLNIWLDADNSDLDVEAIENITGHKCLVIQNTHQTMKFDVHWYVGTEKIDARSGVSKLLPNNKAALEKELINLVATGKKALVCSDNQIYLESLQRLINGLFPTILCNRVDSHTKADNEQGANEYLESPKQWILEFRPRVTLLSPTGEASLDINEKNEDRTYCDYQFYDAVFGFYFGVMSPYGIRQHLCRYRRPVPRFVWVREWSQTNGGLTPKECSRELWRKNKTAIETLALTQDHENINEVDLPTYLESLEKIVDRKSGEWKDSHLINWADYAARDNYHRRHLREVTRQLLEKAGHTIVGEFSIIAESHTRDLVKAIKVEKSEAIANTCVVSEDEAKELRNRRDLTTQERYKLTRYNLEQIVPGELTPEMAYEVKFQQPQLLDSLKALWMLKNPDGAKTINSYRFKSGVGAADPLWDLNTNPTLTTRLGEQLKVLEWIERFSRKDPKEGLDRESLEVLEFIEHCKKFKKQIFLTWRINLRDDTDPIRFINLILKKFAHCLNSRQVRVSGDRIRLYHCVPLSQFHDDFYQRVEKSQGQKLSHIAEKEYISIFQRCVTKTAPETFLIEKVPELVSEVVPEQTDEEIEADVWQIVGMAFDLDETLETFGDIWPSIQKMGQRFADMVCDRFGDAVKAVDPGWYEQYAF